MIRIRWLAAAALALVVSGSPTEAADGARLRDYIVLRVGPAYFTSPDESPFVELENPALEGVIGGAIGVNMTRHLGTELAFEYMETALIQPGTGQKIGEYGLWALLGQARLRYPMRQDRLVPYVVGGIGIGFGEMNDRNFANAGLPGRPAIPLNGPPDMTFVGVAGAGVEYFVTDNVALGLEAKHYFLTGLDLEYAGQKTPISFDSLVGTLGMRVFFDPPPRTGRQGSPAADRDGFRPYLALRAGMAFFTDPDAVPSAELDTPVGFGGLAFGFNVDRYWGVEYVGEGLPGRLEASLLETSLSMPGVGEVVEYSVWTNLLQLRLRYPMMEDALVPYVIVGGGLGFAELNDRRVPVDPNSITGDFQSVWVGAVGAGIEYFIANDIAIGVEAKHILFFEPEINLAGRPEKLHLDPLFLNLNLRLFF
jgi:opacity protein-like surface antigen